MTEQGWVATKTRILVLTIGLAGAFVAILICSRIFRGDPINQRTYGRILEGMTLKEVEQEVGQPPSAYSIDPIYPVVRIWSFDTHQILVYFSLEGKVCGKAWRERFD